MAIATFASLLEKTLKELGSDFRREFTISEGKGVLRAKYLVAFDRKRESKDTLRAFMDREFGYIDANAYKPAKVFRELVALNNDGTAQDTAGNGKITEAHFDAVKSIKIQIEVSAVLGYIEKAYGDKPELAAPDREELAKILREHKKDEDTMKLVRALKAKLKPEPAEKAESETKDEEEEGAESAKSVPLTPLGVLNLLHGEQGKATWAAIVEIARANPDQIADIAKAIAAVAANATTMGTIVASLAPQTAVAA